MSLRAWATSETAALDREAEVETTSPTALDFLAALSSSPLKFFTSHDLNLEGPSVRVAGQGGHAVIEIGTIRVPRKRLVAVKRSRLLPSTPSVDERENGFGRDFEQLTRELRILGHRKVRKHPNIIEVLGICVDEINGSPVLALVLEYSSNGTLKDYLIDRRAKISIVERSDFALQVARGLDALHKLKVCHGDVKIENTLVFLDNETCRVKISDFGQSVIASNADPNGRVSRPVGTPLFEAPEIGRGVFMQEMQFVISDAILTDVFSFGLLVWEVMKLGQSFFDPGWMDDAASHKDLDSSLEYLRNLPEDALLALALEFIENLEIKDGARNRLVKVLGGCLRDIPGLRKEMHQIVGTLEETAPSPPDSPSNSSFESLGSLEEILGDAFPDTIVSWSTKDSLYEIIDRGTLFGSHDLIHELPIAIQQQILRDLKALASAETLNKAVRAHAAMTVSECYTLGFGGAYDMGEVIRWLGIASAEGLHKASLWYRRVCSAAGFEPQSPLDPEVELMEERLALHDRPQRYLVERIHYINRHEVGRAKHVLDYCYQDDGNHPGPLMNLSIFNSREVDVLSPLHVASLSGHTDMVVEILKDTDPNAASALGFNAVHFACLGGHLSTLKQLITSGVPVQPAAFHLITPLHLSVFFRSQEVAEAVALLLENDRSALEASTPGEIPWEAHDLYLSGNPIQWAITVRYKALVQVLLQEYPSLSDQCLGTAIHYFYWDILEDLLCSHPPPKAPNYFARLRTVRRPFAHWIAHGSEHGISIKKTVDLCSKNGLINFNSDGSSHLDDLICNAAAEDDIILIDAILSTSSPSYAKCKKQGGFSWPPINSLFQKAGHNPAWHGTLERFARFYTLDEIAEEAFLLDAVRHDSLEGARVLLEYGADSNKAYASLGFLMETPLQTCIGRSGSIAMMSLLVEFGADVLVKHPISRLAPLRQLLSGRLQSKEVLEVLLRREHPDQVYIETLHTTLRLQYHEFLTAPKTKTKDPEVRADGLNHLRALLTHQRFVDFIDRPDDSGATMIQQASYMLHAPAVRLLLDATADAGRAFRRGQLSALPLELACAQARGLYAVIQQGLSDPFHHRRRAHAMDVGAELLKWHAARGDGLFGGITELHLACKMLLEDDIKRLLSEGQDLNAKGCWPGIDGEVTARELLELHADRDADIVNCFPIPDQDVEEPLEEASELLDNWVLTRQDQDGDSSSSESNDLEY